MGSYSRDSASSLAPVARQLPRIRGGATAEAGALETYQDISARFTADGHLFRGNPQARLTLVESSEDLCPFCARYFGQTLPALLERYGRTGRRWKLS